MNGTGHLTFLHDSEITFSDVKLHSQWRHESAHVTVTGHKVTRLWSISGNSGSICGQYQDFNRSTSSQSLAPESVVVLLVTSPSPNMFSGIYLFMFKGKIDEHFGSSFLLMFIFICHVLLFETKRSGTSWLTAELWLWLAEQVWTPHVQGMFLQFQLVLLRMAAILSWVNSLVRRSDQFTPNNLPKPLPRTPDHPLPVYHPKQKINWSRLTRTSTRSSLIILELLCSSALLADTRTCSLVVAANRSSLPRHLSAFVSLTG